MHARSCADCACTGGCSTSSSKAAASTARRLGGTCSTRSDLDGFACLQLGCQSAHAFAAAVVGEPTQHLRRAQQWLPGHAQAAGRARHRWRCRRLGARGLLGARRAGLLLGAGRAGLRLRAPHATHRIRFCCCACAAAFCRRRAGLPPLRCVGHGYCCCSRCYCCCCGRDLHMEWSGTASTAGKTKARAKWGEAGRACRPRTG